MSTALNKIMVTDIALPAAAGCMGPPELTLVTSVGPPPASLVYVRAAPELTLVKSVGPPPVSLVYKFGRPQFH